MAPVVFHWYLFRELAFYRLIQSFNKLFDVFSVSVDYAARVAASSNSSKFGPSQEFCSKSLG